MTRSFVKAALFRRLTHPNPLCQDRSAKIPPPPICRRQRRLGRRERRPGASNAPALAARFSALVPARWSRGGARTLPTARSPSPRELVRWQRLPRPGRSRKRLRARRPASTPAPNAPTGCAVSLGERRSGPRRPRLLSFSRLRHRGSRAVRRRGSLAPSQRTGQSPPDAVGHSAPAATRQWGSFSSASVVYFAAAPRRRGPRRTKMGWISEARPRR